MKYYSLEEIDKLDCRYNVIFGERSNGKTSAVLEKILKNYCENGKQGAVIRRWDEDLRGAKGDQVWASIAQERDLVSQYSKGEWDRVIYQSRMWFLAKWDEDLQRVVKDNQPFCFAFALSQMEHYNPLRRVHFTRYSRWLSHRRMGLIPEYPFHNHQTA